MAPKLVSTRTNLEEHLRLTTPVVSARQRVSMPATQRRNWNTAIKMQASTAREHTRLKSAIEKYDPVTPPAWYNGVVECNDNSHKAKHFFVFGCIQGVLALLGLSFLRGADLLIAGAFLMLAVVSLAIAGALSNTYHAHTLFTGLMPEGAIKRYQEAKRSGLFDSILVYAPERRLFSHVEFNAVDPLLIGRIGSYAFLIAHWDIAADLTFIESTSIEKA